ncbi:hypothetical protein [Thalassiella azotivora]
MPLHDGWTIGATGDRKSKSVDDRGDAALKQAVAAFDSLQQSHVAAMRELQDAVAAALAAGWTMDELAVAMRVSVGDLDGITEVAHGD